MKVSIFEDSKDEYRSNIHARNGEIVARSSEGYKTIQGCLHGLSSAFHKLNIVRKVDKNGKPYFLAVAGNHEPLLISEIYSSNQAMETGIAALQKIFETDFVIVDKDNQAIDAELLLKAGLPVKSGKQFLIKVDGKIVKMGKFGPTGEEILQAVGKNSNKFELIQKFTLGRTEVVQTSERVDLRMCGVEKFVTIPLDQTNGKGTKSLAECQRDFLLLEEDLNFLEGTDYTYDLVRQSNQMWVIIHNYKIPSGYQKDKVDVALLLSTNYPDVQIDMAYFYPFLERKDKKAIPQTQIRAIISGNQYQGWSRHRTSANPWRPNTDNISTHLRCVENWLRKGLL